MLREIPKMLLNTKVVMSSLMVLLFIGSVYATCESDIAEINETKVYRNYLKQNLFAFLANPKSTEVQLNVSEIKASIQFFAATTGDINASVICEESGPAQIATYGNINLSMVAEKFMRQRPRNYVPRCNDATPYGECSATKPFFCNGGVLVEKCAGPDNDLGVGGDDCGCPGVWMASDPCNAATGQCAAECTTDTDCSYMSIMQYECRGTQIFQVIPNITCAAGSCVSSSGIEFMAQDCAWSSQCCNNGSMTCFACTALQMRNSTCLSVNIPSTMQAEQTYPVQIMMYNSGTQNWSYAEGYHLSSNGGGYWSPPPEEIPGSTIVRPNETYVFNFTLTAPNLQGTYGIQWQMQYNGSVFGQACAPQTVHVLPG
jgi:hypothetical protein